MTGPTLISTAEVAGILEMDVAHFLRVRRELEDYDGFPLPVPYWKRPMKWQRDRVEGWKAAQGRPKAETPGLPEIPPGGNVVRLMDFARQA